MRPRALPVKDLAGPVMSWPHHLAQAGLLQRRRPAFFRANYYQATLLSLEHDDADVSLALGQQLSSWALAVELAAFSKLGLPPDSVFQYVGRCQQPRLREVPLVAAQ
eukprot:5756995-Pyramimonas_sp.AAC.1